MKPAQIRVFLADPLAWGELSPERVELWRRAVDGIILPGIERVGAPRLRPHQEAAIRGFGQHRCALLLGPPGTGKTRVLGWAAAGLAAAARDRGGPFRILFTAFTRNAVLNLLEATLRAARTLGTEVPVCFVGDPGQPTEVPTLEVKRGRSVLETEGVQVVGMTTWAAYRLLDEGDALDAPWFDVVALDEASQMKVGQALMALGPLKDDGQFLVAGDNRQLPPIGAVEGWSVDDRNIGGSIYEFLQRGGIPEFPLTETFRLNAVLTDVPAQLFYEVLEPAPEVAERRLRLREGWEEGLDGWLRAALHPDHPVCVLLHDGPPAATRNPVEAELVKQVVEALGTRLRDSEGNPYEGRLWQDGVAVITPHRAQNALIRDRLRNTRYAEGCVVETVDRIQGRERDAVVLSYTVADPEFAAVEASFILSPHRFNVAITRPRHKLVVVISRRLLEVVPSEDEWVDALDGIREFVFGATPRGVVRLQFGGRPVEVQVRTRAFADAPPLPDIEARSEPTEPLPEWTDRLRELDRVIRDLAAENAQWGTTASFAVDRRVARKVPFHEYRDLFRLGRILLWERVGKHGPFWSIKPVDDGERPRGVTEATVRQHLVDAVRMAAGAKAPYETSANSPVRGVRDRFVWCDDAGRDILWPLIEALAPSLNVRALDLPGQGKQLELLQTDDDRALPPEPKEPPSDDEFRLLNLLEDLEVRRIDLGIVEGWTTVVELRDACRNHPELSERFPSRAAVLRGLETLEAHGHVLVRGDRVRSRMGELARELRYVKQRFAPGDEDRRPFLVRALKVIARTRDKPVRDRPLPALLEPLAGELGRQDPHFGRVVRALGPALARGLRQSGPERVLLSGFQERGIRKLLHGWAGNEPVACVITADTGSGKTETACVPLLAGAARDRLAGVAGCKAVLVYPRIRLAVNQVERLVRYARELDRELGGIGLSVAIQCTGVPPNWDAVARYPRDYEGWAPADEGLRQFPFFRCPACGEPLRIRPGDRRDELLCVAEGCGWSFAGWVATQEGLRRDPPDLLLVVTESLHQWLMDPQYGPLFGDDPGFAPPRALLADEIHLYGHVHGAQVGWALRRFLARCRINGQAAPLAVGMSATLGDPEALWGELSGVRKSEVERIDVRPEERVENPRGREYYYFVQPEVESRGSLIAGASTTIQSVMLLAHGMRRRTGAHGGYRTIVFLDSIDKLKRLHRDFQDAEEKKNLGSLRTSRYGADPADPERTQTACCGEPETCDRFRNGECWYFAAHDPHQVSAKGRLRPGDSLAVAPTPVFSGTSGNVERMIDQSDVLFATSSLEVGFDDPDMQLVYQHYAPANLAAFVQRKGRGGRGSDDRPLTGVTLSIHSPRDSWFFRAPEKMLEGAEHRVPLNMKNPFVVRGQLLAFVLDLAARHAFRHGWRTDPAAVPDEVFARVDEWARSWFGPEVWDLVEAPGIRELWAETVHGVPGLRPGAPPRKWREEIEAVPTVLFEPINVPLLRVEAEAARTGTEPRVVTEDVVLGLSEAAPGNMTLRWGFREAHWIPFRLGRGPFGTGQDVAYKTFPVLPREEPRDLRAFVPAEAKQGLRGLLPPRALARPVTIRPQVAGTFRGASWTPKWKIGAEGPERIPAGSRTPGPGSPPNRAPGSWGSRSRPSRPRPNPGPSRRWGVGPTGISGSIAPVPERP